MYPKTPLTHVALFVHGLGEHLFGLPVKSTTSALPQQQQQQHQLPSSSGTVTPVHRKFLTEIPVHYYLLILYFTLLTYLLIYSGSILQAFFCGWPTQRTESTKRC